MALGMWTYLSCAAITSSTHHHPHLDDCPGFPLALFHCLSLSLTQWIQSVLHFTRIKINREKDDEMKKKRAIVIEAPIVLVSRCRS